MNFHFIATSTHATYHLQRHEPPASPSRTEHVCVCLRDRWSPKRRRATRAGCCTYQNKCIISMQIGHIPQSITSKRAWHLLWICMSLWQLKAGERWEEEVMIAQAGRATGHSTLRRCNSSPPHHFTQLLYWFCNWNLFLSPPIQLPLCCLRAGSPCTH